MVVTVTAVTQKEMYLGGIHVLRNQTFAVNKPENQLWALVPTVLVDLWKCGSFTDATVWKNRCKQPNLWVLTLTTGRTAVCLLCVCKCSHCLELLSAGIRPRFPWHRSFTQSCVCSLCTQTSTQAPMSFHWLFWLTTAALTPAAVVVIINKTTADTTQKSGFRENSFIRVWRFRDSVKVWSTWTEQFRSPVLSSSFDLLLFFAFSLPCHLRSVFLSVIIWFPSVLISAPTLMAFTYVQLSPPPCGLFRLCALHSLCHFICSLCVSSWSRCCACSLGATYFCLCYCLYCE